MSSTPSSDKPNSANRTEDRQSASSEGPILSVRHLRVEFPVRHANLVALDDVSFDIAPGEVLGVVGESGAGKSMIGNAVIRLLEPPGRIASGEIHLAGRRIDNLPEDEFVRLRGRHIGMIFQDPLTSLNPLFSIGDQLVETIRTHLPLNEKQARALALDLLAEVGIPAPETRFDSYPHQLSGGMRQRVVIVLALAAQPQLIIADEPTTALDVSVQAQILALLKRLCAGRGAAVMLITHDMGVIAENADRVAVMYAGRLIEIGPVNEVIHRPRHPYTEGLMAAIPRLDGRRERLYQIEGAMPRLAAIPSGCAFHPRCPHAAERCRRERPELIPSGDSLTACWLHDPESPVVRRQPQVGERVVLASSTPRPAGEVLVKAIDLVRHFDVSKPWINRVLERTGRVTLKAVDGVSLVIRRGETLSLVGESGCGKSTLARLIVGLYDLTRGRLFYAGEEITDLARRSGRRAAAVRKRFQMIFQDPYASLNPLWRVGAIIGEPLRYFRPEMSDVDRRRRVGELLEQVGLSAADALRYPHEFSGGQRQRISIARALANEPEFLVCDEPTSALDVSVQAQILNLMKDLQQQYGLTYLFISHDMAVVKHMADRIAVMYLGRIVEVAASDRLFATAYHPYSRMLLDAVPSLEGAGKRRTMIEGEVPNPIHPPSGCAFHPRCPHAFDRCRREVPVLTIKSEGSEVACHAVAEGRIV